MKKISCVIPAYNEAARIGRVVSLAVAHPLIDEVVVVDDGSSDGTKDVVAEFPNVRLIAFSKNLGKSSAVRAGIEAAEGEYVMLLDADLEGLSSEDLSDLIYPILDGEAELTISLRKRTAPICYLLGIDYTSGERIFPRRMLDERAFEELSKLPGFWLEVFLNDLTVRDRLKIKVVRWRNTFSALKWAKRGILAGTIGEIRMRLDIYRTIGIPRIVTQIRDLRRLMVNPRRLNFEYLGLYQEIPLFFLLPFARKPLSPGAFAPNRILIADATPLIGEFIASIPAISAYVRSRPNTPVDLLVAPVMVPLARKIRGIGKIFATEKPHPDRNVRTNSEDFPEYGLAVTLRMNRDSYRMLTNVRIGRIRTGAGHFIWYAAHLFASVCKRKTPVQWREMNFRMLDETPDDVPFETMFEFSESERNDVLKKPGMATDSKRIIVHTGTNWIMKQWENGKWIELLNRLHQKTGATFVFIWAGNDVFDYERISAWLAFESRSLIGKADLAELALILRESDYFIGIDSGPGNLAHLVGTKSVHIMGPGPHMYRPLNEKKHVVLDKTGGRGLYEMFFSRKNGGYIHRITATEALRAFESID